MVETDPRDLLKYTLETFHDELLEGYEEPTEAQDNALVVAAAILTLASVILDVTGKK